MTLDHPRDKEGEPNCNIKHRHLIFICKKLLFFLNEFIVCYYFEIETYPPIALCRVCYAYELLSFYRTFFLVFIIRI